MIGFETADEARPLKERRVKGGCLCTSVNESDVRRQVPGFRISHPRTKI